MDILSHRLLRVCTFTRRIWLPRTVPFHITPCAHTPTPHTPYSLPAFPLPAPPPHPAFLACSSSCQQKKKCQRAFIVACLPHTTLPTLTPTPCHTPYHTTTHTHFSHPTPHTARPPTPMGLWVSHTFWDPPPPATSCPHLPTPACLYLPHLPATTATCLPASPTHTGFCMVILRISHTWVVHFHLRQICTLQCNAAALLRPPATLPPPTTGCLDTLVTTRCDSLMPALRDVLAFTVAAACIL